MRVRSSHFSTALKKYRLHDYTMLFCALFSYQNRIRGVILPFGMTWFHLELLLERTSDSSFISSAASPVCPSTFVVPLTRYPLATSPGGGTPPPLGHPHWIFSSFLPPRHFLCDGSFTKGGTRCTKDVKVKNQKPHLEEKGELFFESNHIFH
jgi:hypothetical protein